MVPCALGEEDELERCRRQLSYELGHSVLRSRLRSLVGLQHRDLTGIRTIGVDEVLWHRGHKYLTVVYQLDEHCRRLLWVGRDRTTETLEAFFKEFGLRARWLQWVCSDMWRPYLDVLARRAKNAVHVLDRFHIVAKMNKAIDEVRAAKRER